MDISINRMEIFAFKTTRTRLTDSDWQNVSERNLAGGDDNISCDTPTSIQSRQFLDTIEGILFVICCLNKIRNDGYAN